MVQTPINTFYNREQEREDKAQERDQRKVTRLARVLATLQGSPMANPKCLKNKARGKCLICSQAGHWDKECPNHNKSPKMACYKCHQLGSILPLGSKSLKVKHQAPHDSSIGLKWPTPASLPVTDNHYGDGAKGATRCGR